MGEAAAQGAGIASRITINQKEEHQMSKSRNKKKNAQQDMKQEPPAKAESEQEKTTDEPNTGYIKPDWRDEDGNFVRCDKKEFGHSLQGKIDFCQHQIELYQDRQKDLNEEMAAKNDPKAKLQLQIDRRKKALADAEAELAVLEK